MTHQNYEINFDEYHYRGSQYLTINIYYTMVVTENEQDII